MLILISQDGLRATVNSGLNIFFPIGDQEIWVMSGITTEDKAELLVAVKKRGVAGPGGFHITHPFLLSQKLCLRDGINFCGLQCIEGRITKFMVGIQGSLKKFGSLKEVLKNN